jgi:amidophosphoribosyltransferase
MEGISVTDARHNFGRRLYERDMDSGSPALEADFVAPVLFSAWYHGEGYELASGKPLIAAFLPPQFSDRTYNISDVEMRLLVRMLKHRTVKSNLKGKKVVVVDDSIRSSITISGMIRDLRKAGAKEIHVRIGSPVSVRNCPWAPPPTKKEEYIAATHSIEDIRQMIGADTLAYLEVEDMSECIGIDSDRLCLDCFFNEK